MTLRQPKLITNKYQSIFYGPIKSPRGSQWSVRVRHQGKSYYLNSYADERVAAVIYAICAFLLAGSDGLFDPRIGMPEFKDGEMYIWGPYPPRHLQSKELLLANNVQHFGPINQQILSFCRKILNKEGGHKRLIRREIPAIEQQIIALLPPSILPTDLTHKSATLLFTEVETSNIHPLSLITDAASATQLRPSSTQHSNKNEGFSLAILPYSLETYEYELTAPKFESPFEESPVELETFDFHTVLNQYLNNSEDEVFLPDVVPESNQTEPYTLKITTLFDNIISASLTFRETYYVLGLYSNYDNLDANTAQIRDLCDNLVYALQGKNNNNLTTAMQNSITTIMQLAINNDAGWNNIKEIMQALETPSFPLEEKLELAKQLSNLQKNSPKLRNNTI